MAFAVTALQIGVLIGAARARGIHFDIDGGRRRSGSLAAASLFTVGMYGVGRDRSPPVCRAPEEYIGRVPAIAIVPWFFAGVALPDHGTARRSSTWIARFLPLTHALALVRYGLLNDSTGLHNIWRMDSAPGMAALSLGVVAVFAAALTAAGIRLFNRSAVS